METLEKRWGKRRRKSMVGAEQRGKKNIVSYDMSDNIHVFVAEMTGVHNAKRKLLCRENVKKKYIYIYHP